MSTTSKVVIDAIIGSAKELFAERFSSRTSYDACLLWALCTRVAAARNGVQLRLKAGTAWYNYDPRDLKTMNWGYYGPALTLVS